MLSAGAVRLYGDAIRTGTDLRVRDERGGASVAVDMTRYLGAADATDLTVLPYCIGRVLDVGCGPGRMVAALEAADVPALGIDIAREAVHSARARGGWALRRDVYGAVPLEGSWGTTLLLDGNIGIGGDPERLLHRMRALVVSGGRVIVETDLDRSLDDRRNLVLIDRDGRSDGFAFPWARIGRDRLGQLATRAGFDVATTWSDRGRDFTLLRTAALPPVSAELTAAG